MTKSIAAIFMAIMLLAQIGMAQHTTVHFTDHGHHEHHHHDHGHSDHEDHEKNVSEDCQICVITKSLSFGLAGEKLDLQIQVVTGCGFLKNHDQIAGNFQYVLYNPRAPPDFLI